MIFKSATRATKTFNYLISWCTSKLPKKFPNIEIFVTYMILSDQKQIKMC